MLCSSVASEGAPSGSASVSHGFLRRIVLSIFEVPGSSTVSGTVSMPGMGLFSVISSTMSANEVG